MSEQDRLAQALELVKAGNRAEALPIVAEVIRVDRNNTRAWILMARIVDDPEKALQCWQQVARLKPDDPRVQEEIAKLKGEPAPHTQPTAWPPGASSFQSSIATPAQSDTSTPVQPIDTAEEKKNSRLPLLIAAGVTIIVIICGVALVIAVKNMLPDANRPATSAEGASTTVTEPTVILTSTAASTLTPAPASIPVIPPEIKQRAAAGVTHNADWTPYTQEINGVPMALVPAGCFMMGITDEQARALCTSRWGPDEPCPLENFSSEQPAHEVCFEEPFWIDVYEVTNKVFGSVGCKRYPSSPNQPRDCVIWEEARAHCEVRGARLPTEAEWEYTTRGPDGLMYPWGNEFVADNVTTTANADGDTWDVGSKPGGVSWIGAYDLSGNVEEWVADWYRAYPSGQQIVPTIPGRSESRVKRGGRWGLDASYLRATFRFPGDPYGTNDTVGFRCARSLSTPASSPTPTSTATIPGGAVSSSQRIVFTRVTYTADDNVLHDVYMVNSDGSGLTNLTNNPQLDEYYPVWLPDRSGIQFVGIPNPALGSERDNDYYKGTAIYRLRFDGSPLEKLVELPPNLVGLHQQDLTWSPDRTRMVFNIWTPYPNSETHVVNIDGSGEVNLGFVGDSPSWAPDSSALTLTTRAESGYIYKVEVVSLSGNPPAFKSTLPGHDSIWSPDGTHIASLCVIDNNGGTGLCMMDSVRNGDIST